MKRTVESATGFPLEERLEFRFETQEGDKKFR